MLTPDEAYELLTSRRAPMGEAEEQEANDLGLFELALDVTGSSLISYSSEEPYRKFREELVSQDCDALELATETADALPNGHQKSIAQTMLGSNALAEPDLSAVEYRSARFLLTRTSQSHET